MSLNIAAGLGLGGNESYPDVFAPFGGFADNTAVVDSMVSLHQRPGVGFEENSALIMFKKEQVRFTQGERRIYRSSPAVERTFCPDIV